MCTQCLYTAQWLGVNPGDTPVALNGATYPAGIATIGQLVASNPQFWFQPGVNGQQTLTTTVTNGQDLMLITNTGTYKASIQAHPPHAPH